MRTLAIAMAIALGGCAAQYMNASMYTRTDGRPVDPAQQQAAIAQCKGEGATAVRDYVTGEGFGPWVAGMFSRSSKEEAVVNACMARNGYIHAQQ